VVAPHERCGGARNADDADEREGQEFRLNGHAPIIPHSR
jgi:hypothetical protein